MIMCNSDDYIAKAIDWINKYIQSEASVTKRDEVVRLKVPLMVAAPYSIFYGSLFNSPVIYLYVKNYREVSPGVVKRHGEIIENASGLTPIFVFNDIESYKTLRLANNKVNFIVTDKVIFLPEFLLLIRDQRPKLQPTFFDDVIPATAQLMVLYHLQRKSLDGFTAGQISKLLKVSYATGKRAISWLVNNNVLHLEGKKEKVLKFDHNGKELWEFIEDFLRNPIESKHTTDDITQISEYKIAGETALSEYTLLGDNALTVAISKNEQTRLNRLSKNWDLHGGISVQTWIYNPNLLSNGNVIDKLSLYLTLKDNDDERVQIELEKLMQKIKW